MKNSQADDFGNETVRDDRPVIEVSRLFKIFGDQGQDRALKLAQEGATKAQIQHETGCVVAINDVSFSVRTQETFVIMGLSGCGKSTVLRCINSLIQPTHGKVLVGDENVAQMSREQLVRLRRKKMSMVFQNFGLLPHKTVLENAAFGLEIRGVPQKERREHARKALDLVGLSDTADQRVQALSGGMQQRVGLARALATDTEILLMDEAFSALDPLIRSEMQDELIALQEKMRKTIVFITHDLDEALRLGDRIAIMKEGRVIQLGTPEEILVHPSDSYIRSFVENVDRSRVLTAESIIRRPGVTINATASLSDAMNLFRDHSFETLFVVDDEGSLKGRILIDHVVDSLRQGDTDLAGVIDGSPTGLPPETPVEELLPLASHSHHPIPIVDNRNRLLGLVTRTAILTSMLRGQPTSGQAALDDSIADKSPN